jgi:hypothetical protein
MKLIVAFRNFAKAPTNKHKRQKNNTYDDDDDMTKIIIMLIARGSRDLVEKK